MSQKRLDELFRWDAAQRCLPQSDCDPDDEYTYRMAMRQAAKSASFTDRYGHIFVAPKPTPQTWINVDYTALELRIMAEITKQLEDDMNEKIKKALEAARLFVGGLSQYDNKVLPKSAYQEAKGLLGLIGEALGVVERPPPLPTGTLPANRPFAYLDSRIPAREPEILPGLFLSPHDCGNKFCDCRQADASQLDSRDVATWDEAKAHITLRLLHSKSLNRKRFTILSKAGHQAWGSPAERLVVRAMVAKLIVR